MPLGDDVAASARNATRAKMPERILAAYANWGECDDKLATAAEEGVNVLIWFSINLAATADGTAPAITGPATGKEFLDCVASKVAAMRERGLNVVHLVSVGGWNSPHPDTRFTSAQWWAEWVRWNTGEVARPEAGWEGFAGLDWDVEGNDDGKHHGNEFAIETLDLMGAISALAKHDGYVVAMAPTQSYLDPGTSEFSRRVNFPPREPWHQDFFYAGRNAYAYILARYGVGLFDFVSIQLYEGWSGANFAVSEERVPPADMVEQLVDSVLRGWDVDFTSDPVTAGLGVARVEIARHQLVVGLANGWTSPPPDKFLLVWPEDCGEAYRALEARGAQPRGFMFWNVADEGATVPRTDPPRKLRLAPELAAFLRPRRDGVADGAVGGSDSSERRGDETTEQ